MILVNASDLKKEFGDRILFDNVSFSIENNDKIGFVGVNGAGKSTLFKMLTGEVKPDGGEIFINRESNIGYMKQHANLDTKKTVWEEVLSIYKPVIDIENELRSIENRIENKIGDLEILTKSQEKLNSEYERLGGFLYQNVARASLLGLGFSEEEFNMDFNNLSGGQQTRVILCKLLLGQSNLLLLDEPTNHLDIDSIEWLENFLKNYGGAYIVISHDRYFLDKVTNKTFEIENKKLTVYKGNYTKYIEQKKEREKALLKNFENTSKEISRIEGIIEQQKRWNREKNIKTAQSKQKQIDRLKSDLEKPEILNEGIKFKFGVKSAGPKEVLRVFDLGMSFSEKKLFDNANIEINRGERVFLLGSNGCGKTTMFKIITGELKPTSGSVKIGESVVSGYFDQKQQNLCDEKEAIDEVWDEYPDMTMTEVRNAMAAFLIRNDEVFSRIGSMSGGERARIALIKLMLMGANFLILDEPTNHLDIKSREALEDALLGYDGTMFVISHDRYFINKLATKIYYMSDSGVTLYGGDYSYFLKMKKDDAKKEEQVREESTSKRDYREQKQYEAKIRKLKNDIKKTEEEIELSESRISDFEDQLADEKIATDFEASMDISNKMEEEKKKLEDLYEVWEKLSAELLEAE